MLAKVFTSLHRAFVLVALMVALTATGFAHRMPTADDSALAFALANGADASDFCGGTAGGGRAGSLHCAACQITASADLPPLAGAPVPLELAFQARTVALCESVARRSILDPGHTPQAPPVA